MNSYDHYSETHELASMLRNEAMTDEAEALEKAINEGVTGSEIFMALRWHVKRIIDAKNCTDLTKEKAKRLYKELDKALQ